MELEGKKGLLVAGQSRCTCSVQTVCLRLVILIGFQGRFGPKKAALGHKISSFLEGHLPTWRAGPGAPPLTFWLNTWIWQGHHLGSRMARVK